MCLYPRLVINPRYTKTKKNGGIIPPIIDTRVLRVPIGCGVCMECKKQYALNWKVRLLEDVRHYNNGKFITLTFSNESYTNIVNYIQDRERASGSKTNSEGYILDNKVATQATRWFLERWRKKYKKSVRHWLVTELGHRGTENIHIHGIIWCDDKQLMDLDNIWKYGFVWKGYKKNGKLENYVNEKTVNYITKYVSKMDIQHKTYKPIVLCSAGIGRKYIERGDKKRNKFSEGTTDESYRTRSGHKIALPKYYRNKLYTDEEREALWLHKLDKMERWVNGERATNDEQYYKLLEFHRIKNKQLGYGHPEDWKRAEYEHARRILLQKERIHPPGAPPAGG